MAIIYDPNIHKLNQLRAFQNEGEAVLCHICGGALIIALTLEEADRQRVHPGIYCRNDKAHVGLLVSLKAAHVVMQKLIQSFKKDDV